MSFIPEIVKSYSQVAREASADGISVTYPPLVVMEDKISNMVKLIVGFSPDHPEFTISENDFNSEKNNSYQEFMAQWHAFIIKYPHLFTNTSFIYFPPDKNGIEDIAATALQTSPKESCVRDFIQRTNAFIDEAVSSSYPQATKPQHRGFHHVEDHPEEISSIWPDNAVVIADVDGPLVLQNQVLNTREALLKQVLAAELDFYYQKYFGLDCASFIRLVCQMMQDKSMKNWGQAVSYVASPRFTNFDNGFFMKITRNLSGQMQPDFYYEAFIDPDRVIEAVRHSLFDPERYLP